MADDRNATVEGRNGDQPDSTSGQGRTVETVADGNTLAAALVDVACGLFEAEAVSLWQFDDDVVRLLARAAPSGLPVGPLSTEPMEKLIDALSAGEIVEYDRSGAPAGLAESMRVAGLEQAMVVPVRAGELLLACAVSWAGECELSPLERFGPMVERFTERAAALVSVSEQRRRADVLHLVMGDDVLQSLLAATLMFDLGDVAEARAHVDAALAGTRRAMEDMLAGSGPGELRREDTSG